MYVRETKRALFKIQKFDKHQLAQDPGLRERASKGIKYDGFLKRKPAFDEYIDKMYKKYLRKV